MEAGASAFMSKPFSPPALTTQAQTLLAAQSEPERP
jgi:CheY-like chemotaxis protein